MNQIDTETNKIILTDNLDRYIVLIDMNIHAGAKLGIVIMLPSPQTAAHSNLRLVAIDAPCLKPPSSAPG